MEKFTVDLDKVLDDFEDTEELGQGTAFIEEQDDKKVAALDGQRPEEQDRRPDLIAPFEGCVFIRKCFDSQQQNLANLILCL